MKDKYSLSPDEKIEVEITVPYDARMEMLDRLAKRLLDRILRDRIPDSSYHDCVYEKDRIGARFKLKNTGYMLSQYDSKYYLPFLKQNPLIKEIKFI